MSPSTREQEIGARLRAWRERRDLTQTDVAEAIGISQAHVSSLERAHRELYVTRALDFAQALAIDLQTLVTKDPI